VQLLAQADLTELQYSLRRIATAGDGPRRGMREEIGEQFAVAWQGQVQMVANLTGDCRGLLDEIAAMPDAQLQAAVDWVQDKLGDAEAGDGGAVLSVQVSLIGLVIGVGGEAKLFGGERMDDAVSKPAWAKARWGARW